jgi:hypothetical protein
VSLKTCSYCERAYREMLPEPWFAAWMLFPTWPMVMPSG